jgi:hypothetical protein
MPSRTPRLSTSHNVADRHVNSSQFQLLKHMLCLLIHPVSFSPPVLCRAIGAFNAFTQALKVLNSGHGVNFLVGSIAPHLSHDTHQFDLE